MNHSYWDPWSQRPSNCWTGSGLPLRICKLGSGCLLITALFYCNRTSDAPTYRTRVVYFTNLKTFTCTVFPFILNSIEVQIPLGWGHFHQLRLSGSPGGWGHGRNRQYEDSLQTRKGIWSWTHLKSSGNTEFDPYLCIYNIHIHNIYHMVWYTCKYT